MKHKLKKLSPSNGVLLLNFLGFVFENSFHQILLDESFMHKWV